MVSAAFAFCLSADATGELKHVQFLLSSIKTLEGQQLSVASQENKASLDGLNKF